MMQDRKELIHFTINAKRFENKYYNSIIEGIKIKYKEIYPDDILKIVYRGGFQCEFEFLVFKPINVIYENGIESKYVLLESYTNIEAIKIFSSIPMENYLEEYDESKYDYFNKLKDYIDALQVTYRLIGMDFYDITLDKFGYKIQVQKKFKSNFPYKSISKSFKFDIVTERDYLKAEVHIRTVLANIYDANKRG